jgi:hypothetical protein
MEMILFALLSLFTVVYAIVCAHDDAEQIAQNHPVNHTEQWIVRALVVGIPWLLLFGPLKVIAAAFVFSSLFRYKLNKLRGLEWWYVSESNIYDRVFIGIAAGDIRLAGTTAYGVEIVIAFLCIFGL